MKVVDHLTIELTLRQSWGGFRYFLSTEGGMIVNPTVVAAKGDQFSLDPPGAGVGPYELQRFAPNEEIILKAKTDYWDGPVCIDTIRFILVPGGQATYDAFKTGEIDVIFVQEPGIVAGHEEGRGDRHQLHQRGRWRTLLLNAGRGTNPPLADVKPASGHRPRHRPEALQRPGVRRQGVGQLGPGCTPTSASTRRPTDPSTTRPRPRPRRRRPRPRATTATSPSPAATRPAAIEQTITLKAMLEAVGFTVTMQNLPAAQSHQVILIEGNYQIGCGGLSLFDEGMVRGMNQFASTSVRNRVGIKDPKMDAGINQLYQAKDEAEVTRRWRTADRLERHRAGRQRLRLGVVRGSQRRGARPRDVP